MPETERLGVAKPAVERTRVINYRFSDSGTFARFVIKIITNSAVVG